MTAYNRGGTSIREKQYYKTQREKKSLKKIYDDGVPAIELYELKADVGL